MELFIIGWIVSGLVGCYLLTQDGNEWRLKNVIVFIGISLLSGYCFLFIGLLSLLDRKLKNVTYFDKVVIKRKENNNEY